jgi:hypothetical protein
LVPSPIYGGDEYAYFISGIFLENLDTLYINDPGLQQASPYLFFKIINIASKMSENPEILIKIFNTIIFLLSSFIYYKISKKNGSNNKLILPTILLFPFSAYSIAVMPDILYFFIYSIIFLITYLYFPIKIKTFSIIIGFLLGCMILVKPHALSIIISIYFLIIFNTVFMKNLDIKNSIFSLLIISIIIYITITIVSYISINSLMLIPTFILGKSYVGIIDSQYSIFNIIPYVLYNLVAHLIILLFLFSPIILICSALIFKRLKKSSTINSVKITPPTQIIQTSLLCLFSLIITLAMTVFFTAKITVFDFNEIYIIQGRYYEYLFPSIYVLTVFYLQNSYIKESTLKFSGLVVVLCILIWVLFFQNYIKLYPWTNSTLQAISPLAAKVYGISPFNFFILLIFSFGIFTFFKAKYTLKYFCILIFIIWGFGFISITKWQYENSSQTQPYAIEGWKIISMLPPSKRGKGVIFSDERYGNLSYTLFGMASNNRVPYITTKDKVIDQSDLPENLEWVLFSDNINFSLPSYKKMIKLNHYTLVFLN